MTTLPLTEHKRNVLRAWLDGKTIQINRPSGWCEWEDEEPPRFDDDDARYRIKPTPTRRFWRPEEIPVGWQIRKIGTTCSATIFGFSDVSVWISGHSSIGKDDFSNYEVAPPGPANAVTWVPAGVEE